MNIINLSSSVKYEWFILFALLTQQKGIHIAAFG
jgi:hypothetical protein